MFEAVKNFFAPNSEGAEITKDAIINLMKSVRMDQLKGKGFITEDEHVADVLVAHWKIASANLLQKYGLKPKVLPPVAKPAVVPAAAQPAAGA